MNTQKSFVYTAIVLSGFIACCGFFLKDGITAVDRVEETLPERHFEITAAKPSEISVSEETSAAAPTSEPLVVTVVAPMTEPLTEPVTEPQPKTFSPVWPVLGEVTAPFSEKLVYNQVSRDWRSHSGIDIAAKKTERVLAAEDGVILSVYEDPLFGKTIEIDHGSYKTVYKNLSTLIMANEGSEVKKGEAIAGVGEGAVFEHTSDPHLHFEIIKDGIYIDPIPLLDKSTSVE